MRRRILNRSLDAFRRLTPPGIDTELELRWLAAGLGMAAALSLTFFGWFGQALGELYAIGPLGRRTLREGAVMTPFYRLLGNSLWGFAAVALAAPALAVWHYLYHRQGSRADYRMRRLPDRWEYHRRCLALPALALVAAALMAAVMTLIFYGVYRLCTPEQCMAPGQWRMLLDALF